LSLSFPLVFFLLKVPGALLNVRPSVRWPLHAAAAGSLLWARTAGDIDRLLTGARQQPRRSTARISKCGQCHVVS